MDLGKRAGARDERKWGIKDEGEKAPKRKVEREGEASGRGIAKLSLRSMGRWTHAHT